MKNSILALLATVATSTSATANASVWINEFHYDNSGIDIDEGVELAAHAGTDLDGYQLLLYNGTNGQVYQTILLNGVIDDQQTGVGALYFSTEGIQNGPDGIALVDQQGTTIQFISYEGSFTAADGAAMGMSSLDIKVFEAPDTQTGTSLQLFGSGYSYSDFFWSQGASSYGALNAQQNIVAPVPIPGALPLLIGALASLTSSIRRRGASAPNPDISSVSGVFGHSGLDSSFARPKFLPQPKS